MKSIVRKYVFWLKEGIYGSIIAIISILLAYYLDTKTILPDSLVIILTVLIVLILIYVNLAIEHNFYNPLCTYEIEGILLDYIPQYDGLDNVPSYNNFSDIVTIEYVYKNRKYRRIINVSRMLAKKVGLKLKIKICKLCPKMIHVVGQ